MKLGRIQRFLMGIFEFFFYGRENLGVCGIAFLKKPYQIEKNFPKRGGRLGC